MEYKFIEEVAPQIATDEKNKIIEKTYTVEQKETFTIAQLENQLIDLDIQSNSIDERKEEIRTKIADAKSALKIK